MRARRAAYWKAANLEEFNGRAWEQSHDAIQDDTLAFLPDEVVERNMQEIEVTVRNLASDSYITAGFAHELEAPTVRENPRGDGTWTAGRTLRRGDAYTAQVYTPTSSERQRRSADGLGLPIELSGSRRLFLYGSGDFIGQTGAPRFQLEMERLDGVTAGRRSAPALADLDGDGLLDLVLGREAGGLAVYRNAGTRNAPRFVEDASFTLPLPPMSSPALADLDGDGALDVLAGSAGGGVVFWKGSRRR